MSAKNTPPLQSSNHSIVGVWTALATPFRSDGSIDWAAFEHLLKLQEKGGVDGVVICGTTGESPTLTNDEKVELVKRARTVLGKSTRVMAGSGGNDTRQSIELSKRCVDAGADSLLVVTPPYNKPSPAGLQLHFQSIANAVSVPICLYHVPGRTAQSLSNTVLGNLCKIKGIAAVKEASGDVAFFSRAVMKSPDIGFLSGDDPTYLASLAVGGVGVISVITNIFPAAFVKMTRAFQNGDVQLARRIHEILLPVTDSMFCEANPGPLKAALKILGWCENQLRAPLAPVTEDNYKVIATLLQETQLQLSRLNL